MFNTVGSGNARFNAAFTPNAIAFSAAIPAAVGIAPFQKAVIPSLRYIFDTLLNTPLYSTGFVCIRTFTVSCERVTRDKQYTSREKIHVIITNRRIKVSWSDVNEPVSNGWPT